MAPESMTSKHSVMICIIYVLLEAAYLAYRRKTRAGIPDGLETGRIARVGEWKRELVSRAAKGTIAVDAWVEGWFEDLGDKGRVGEVKRGNVEEYLSGRSTSLFTR